MASSNCSEVTEAPKEKKGIRQRYEDLRQWCGRNLNGLLQLSSFFS